MKARVSSNLTTRNEGRYLKPGALARLRDSRIRKPHFAIYQLIAGSETASLQSESVFVTAHMDPFVIPCFDLRRYRSPLCLGRKKLVAVTPRFAGSSSQA